MEKESLGHHNNMTKDIANYHCQLQSLHNDSTVDKQEFNVLRQQCRSAMLNKESQEADCRAHKARLVADVETEAERVAALRAEVTTWEQRLKEVLERKVVAEAEVMARRMSKAAEEDDETVRKLTMSSDSDHEEQDDNDLELSYEGLELSSLMPFPQVLRLAAGRISDHDAMSKVDIPETGLLERGGVELEAEYGEHLRNLEKVLLELRQEQAEQAEDRRCQSRLAAFKQKKREAAAAAAAGKRFPWSIGKWMRQEKAETPTPKASVVSGFSNFSPYSAMCRKYAALAA